MPLAAQVAAFKVGQTEEEVAEASPEVVAVVQASASAVPTLFLPEKLSPWRHHGKRVQRCSCPGRSHPGT